MGSLCTSPSSSVTCRGFKSQHPFSSPSSALHFSLFPLLGAKHERLVRSKKHCILEENYKVTAHAQEKAQKRSEKTSRLHLNLPFMFLQM